MVVGGAWVVVGGASVVVGGALVGWVVVGWVVVGCVVVVVGALTFFPALALGPVVEQLLLAGAR
ncbi:MAG TPA: potassium-transporting ATPase subunit KdpA [Mycolicibacterium fallax]|nr:potassium-transporting ATPase subunit KdpA [Mycolicibacterium fallax]